MLVLILFQHVYKVLWFLLISFSCFSPLLQILLSFLTPGANRIQNQICEVLDTDLIRQQAEHNAVDIHGLANYIINTMGKLCAPIRDNDIKQLKATENIVELLRLVFGSFLHRKKKSQISQSIWAVKDGGEGLKQWHFLIVL